MPWKHSTAVDPQWTVVVQEHASAPAPPRVVAAPSSATRTDLGDVALENQEGARLGFADAFAGLPSALAFFYTRCMNPEKCSLTVTPARSAHRLFVPQASTRSTRGRTHRTALLA